jgi:hypothetical protein
MQFSQISLKTKIILAKGVVCNAPLRTLMVYTIVVYFKSTYLANCSLLTTRINFSKIHSTAINAFSSGIIPLGFEGYKLLLYCVVFKIMKIYFLSKLLSLT